MRLQSLRSIVRIRLPDIWLKSITISAQFDRKAQVLTPIADIVKSVLLALQYRLQLRAQDGVSMDYGTQAFAQSIGKPSIHVMRHMASYSGVGCRRERALRRDFGRVNSWCADDFLVHRMVNAGLFWIGWH